MKKNPVVAIAGATGVVGQEMLSVLSHRSFPFSEVRLFASRGSVGEVYQVGETGEAVVQELTESSFEGVDIALFATSAELSKQFVPCAVEAGAFAIDNSSHFRMDPEVPLVVPEVNAGIVSDRTRVIANPNCSTIQLVPVLNLIEKAAGLKRVVVSTYQSVSGAGKAALDELWSQTLSIFNQKEVVREAFQHQIAFNCIPQIDVLLDSGFTKEENKIMEESKKILSLPNLKIAATAVRVPVFYSHAESVHVETEQAYCPDDLVKALAAAPWASVYPNHSDYPMQIDTATSDEIHVGRIRKDPSVEHGVVFWVVADNVRKGAALNAVQIAEVLLAHDGH